MKIFRKKLSIFNVLFLVVALLFLAVGLGTLGSVSGTGSAYELRVQGKSDAKEPCVVFKLDNLIKEDGSTESYLRLNNVYLNIASIYTAEEAAATLKLTRSSTATGTTYTYTAKVGNLKYVEPPVTEDSEDKDKDKETPAVLDAVGNWVAPFDLSVTLPSNFNVSTYKYYRLTTKSCNILINEVVFVGEKLTKSGGDGTGEYCVIPAEIESAQPLKGEDNETAKKNAGALLDAQRIPVMTQSSYYRLGGGELYSMMTVAEMSRGNTYYYSDNAEETAANVYHADRVYSSLGTSLLAFGCTIFGNSPFGLRFFPMLAAFGALVVGYFLTKEIAKSEKAGFVFALLYALSSMTFSLGRFGTPLMIGVFFYLCSFYFCHRFYSRGMSDGLSGAIPLLLSGLFGAAAICVNGAYTVAMLGVIALFAFGMVRQNKARRHYLDLALAQVEAEESGSSKPTEETAEGEEPEKTGREKAALVYSEYRRKNTVAPTVFFTALVIGTMLMSLLFLLPVYNVYVKLYDNPAAPSLGIFALMDYLYAGGFRGVNDGASSWNLFYKIFTGSGATYAVTGVVINAVAAVAGLLGLLYAVCLIVRVCREKLKGRDARVALRKAVIPFAGMALSLITAAFGGGALAFILLAYLFAFVSAGVCVQDMTETEGTVGKVSRIVCYVGIGLLAAVFLLFAVFTFSVPLPAAFMGKFF